MDTKTLKEYLGMVVDMEANCYLMNRLKADLEWRIASIVDPQLPKMVPPAKPVEPYIAPMTKLDNPQDSESIFKDVFPGVMVIVLLFALASFVLCLEGLFIYIAVAFIIAVMEAMILIVLNNRKRNQNQREHYQRRVSDAQKYHEEYRNYENSFREYQKKVEVERQRLQPAIQKNNRMRAYLKRELADCNQKLQESTQRLQYLYGMNIIFPKYRNFTMVCSLDEYIRAGRCWTLEGPDGAYNILEFEMRMGIIITQLDYIITQLGQIQNNQYVLYSTLQDTNRMLVEIVESNNQIANQLYLLDDRIGEQNASFSTSMDEVRKTSKATAYFAERSQQELRYMNFMNTFR